MLIVSFLKRKCLPNTQALPWPRIICLGVLHSPTRQRKDSWSSRGPRQRSSAVVERAIRSLDMGGLPETDTGGEEQVQPRSVTEIVTIADLETHSSKMQAATFLGPINVSFANGESRSLSSVPVVC
jgi:hypothetical protein